MFDERCEDQDLPNQTQRKARPQLVRRALYILSGAAIAGVCAAWIAGTMLIGSTHQNVGNLPDGIAGQAVEFPSTSGAILRGWLMTGGRSQCPIVLLHGWRADRRAMLDRARFLSAAGYSVLLFDFQAHGDSSGDQITFGYLESKDAQAALDFVKLKLPREPIGVIGV